MKEALSTSVLFALLSIALASVFLSLQQRNEIQILRQELKEQKAFFHQQHHDISPTISNINQEAVKIQSSFVQSTTRYLYVTGLVGDGQADDTRPIKRALKQASKGKRNAIVVLPKGDFKITKPLKIRGGVKLVGQGYGPNPLQIKFQHGGSVLISCVGEGYAIDITEHSAGVENLGITESRSEECVDRSSGVRVYDTSNQQCSPN